MPSSRVPDWLRRGRPSDSVASMWKCASTKGGVTRRPLASISLPAVAFRAGSTVAILPAWTPMSMPRRPSGRLAPRMMRSSMRVLRSALALAIRDHERSWIAGAPRHRDQRQDRQYIGQHQEYLIRQVRARQLLQAQLIGIERREQDCAQERL